MKGTQRLILIAAAASLAACLQTPMPIPPGTGNDASTDTVADAMPEVTTDSPGLDAYDDAAADTSSDPVTEPLPDMPTDTDIGDIAGDETGDAEDDVQDDAEDDADDDAGEEDAPDVT